MTMSLLLRGPVLKRYPFLSSIALPLWLLALTGCSIIQKPLAGDAEAIDESSPQAPARIRLSPPQVYTREQLINDRLREDAFLKAQLDRSATDPLGSSMARDIQTVQSLSGQAAASFDPALRLNFQNESAQANLQQQADLVQLQGSVLSLQNQLTALKAGTGSAPAPLATAPSTTISSGTSTAAPDARIAALQSRLDAALTAAASMSSNIRTNGQSGTLADDFDDRLALRAHIRDVINATQLDDAHDVDGNALYHLEFNATILPGAHKGQYGIASLSIKPPEIKQDDLNYLYYTWLAVITNRMNQDLSKGADETASPMSYGILGPLTGLYDVASLPKIDGKKQSLRLAVRTGHENKFLDVWNKNYALRVLVGGLKREPGNQSPCSNALLRELAISQGTLFTQSTIELLKECKVSNSYVTGFASGGDLEKLLREVVQIAPSVEMAVLALGDRSAIAENMKVEAGTHLQTYLDAFQDARWLLRKLGEECERIGAADCGRYDITSMLKSERNAPAPFCSALFKSDKCPADLSKSGVIVAYPYSTEPATRVQRVSTVASAANAQDLALAAAAQVPSAGASLGGALGYSRRAAGRADALERVPEVIGFAGPSEDSSGYEFGWLFGPKFTLDPAGNNLLLRQLPRSVPVGVDLSVPGWWPRASLVVKVGWRGNFEGKGGVLASAAQDGAGPTLDQYTIPVEFRPTVAALDALTVQLLQASISQGYRQARIDRVLPEILPVCSDAANKNITLLIYGVDLWRNPQVYVGGTLVSSANLAVLPDMAGISAIVDTSTLARSVVEGENTIVVWTAHGAAESVLKARVGTNCDAAAGDATTRTQTTTSTSILRVSPSQISACDATAQITLAGRSLPKEPGRYFLGSIRATGKSEQIKPSSSTSNTRQTDVVTITFSGLLQSNKGLSSLALTVVGDDGVASVPIEIGAAASCGTASKATKDETKATASFVFLNSSDAVPETPAGSSTTTRISVGFPLGKLSSIDISAKNGLIASASFSDAVPPLNVTMSRIGNDITLTTSAAITKDTKPFNIDLTLGGLVRGHTLVLSAKAKPEVAPAPAALNILVGPDFTVKTAPLNGR